MRVVGFCGYSGSGKTTLVEQLVERLRAAGQRVSVVKHAHHAFDIDQPGKDSYRYRAAGAFEVLIASDRRLAKMREFVEPVEPTVHQLIAELVDCDWVLVEGLKHADVCKIEVWRAANGQTVQYPVDPFIVAVCTDSPDGLPEATGLPRLDINDPDAVLAFLLADTRRYDYISPFDGPGAFGDADAARSADPFAGHDQAAR